MMRDFEEIVLSRGRHKVTLSWIGEGVDGDYDEDDPTDEPRLRFDVHFGDEETDNDFYCHSYCTQLTTTDSLTHLLDFMNQLMRLAVNGEGKRAFEFMSWAQVSPVGELVIGINIHRQSVVR